MKTRTASLVLVGMALVACGSPQTAPPVGAPPPAAPGGTGTPTASPTPPRPKTATCPLLCWTEGGACQRPNLTKAQIDDSSCGLLQQVRRARPRPPMVACPGECCPAKGSGRAGDADADGIPDDVDACPNEPEDADGFADWDGCPDPDNDGDGVLDIHDKCCFAPEDKDGDRDLDGCPE